MHAVAQDSPPTALSGSGEIFNMPRLSEVILLGQITFVLVIILLIFSWITVSLRLWVRLRLTKTPGWDDAAMVITLTLFTCYCAFILVITVESAKIHTMANFLRSIVYIQLSEVFYILTTTALKISLGLFFLRLLVKRWQVLIFHTILGVSAVYGVIYVFLTIFQCGNPAKLADRLVASEHCLPSGFLLGSGYLYGVINVLADWTFVLIPIVILIESDMDMRCKISVSIVMGLGSIGSISSILRMVYLDGLHFGGGALSPNAIKATIWATAEPGTGIIASSIAILRPLFRQINTEVRDKMSGYRSGKSFRTETTFQDRRAEDNDSIIALTSVVTAPDSKAWKKASTYSARTDDHDPWSPTITVGRAQIGKMVNIRMTTEERPPPVPPKN